MGNKRPRIKRIDVGYYELKIKPDQKYIISYKNGKSKIKTQKSI